MEYFHPEKSWSLQDLEELTGKKEGLTTWPMRLYTGLPRLGYELVVYDPTDYRRLAEDPHQYISEFFSKEYAEETFKMSDMDSVLKDTQALLSAGTEFIHQERYGLEDMKRLLDDGYVLVTWVDHAKIWGKKDAFWAHDILIYDYEGDTFYANDPGGDDPAYRQQQKPIPGIVLDQATRMNERGDRGELRAFRPQKDAA